jgi:hypothetical protein
VDTCCSDGGYTPGASGGSQANFFMNDLYGVLQEQLLIHAFLVVLSDLLRRYAHRKDAFLCTAWSIKKQP